MELLLLTLSSQNNYDQQDNKKICSLVAQIDTIETSE